MYRIREVDGQDDDVADTLTELHRLTFFDTAPVPTFDHGHWWLVLHEVNLWRLPGSSLHPTSAMPAIFAG